MTGDNMINAYRQRGGVYGTIFLVALFAGAALLGLKVIPIYLNQGKIETAVSNVAAAPQYAKASPYEIRRALEKRWDVDDVKYLELEDIKIDRTNLGNRALAYKYEVRQTLFLNWDLVLTFEKKYPLVVASGA